MPSDLPLWEQRFRAPRVSLPDWAQDAPSRCLYTSNVTGTWELYAWDRDTGSTRQVTRRDAGTSDGALSPDGAWVWWFDDSEGDEFGTWKRQPFEGGPDTDAAPGVPAAYPAGLEVGSDVVLVGCADDDGSAVYAVRDGSATLLYRHEEDADVAALSRDERLLVIEHSEHGDSHHKALRVLDLDGRTVADLWDGEGLGLSVLGFSPVAGDPRLLAVHERTGRPRPFLWDPTTGTQTELPLDDLPGDLAADWFEDAQALLVLSEHAARATLHRLDLASGELTDVPTPRGTVGGATPRPDGTVEYSWSDAASPTVVRSTSGDVVLAPPGEPAPRSVPVEDVRVVGPGGEVHALLARPTTPAPHPTVFLVHGGPTHHDTDAFAGDRAAYVDLGCAVVEVNYRGSTGYGAAWRDAIIGRPGLTELEDLVAVRRHLVDSGDADLDRIALTGASWGGYLTLLGLGVEPGLWTVGVAGVPVADYLAAYEDEMEPLRAFDRALFGGSPAEVRERYEASSPLTYVDAVRAPVLLVAGANDPRCPLRQIENWLAAADAAGKDVEVYRYDAGHGSLVVDERVRQMRVELEFVARHFGLPGPA